MLLFACCALLLRANIHSFQSADMDETTVAAAAAAAAADVEATSRLTKVTTVLHSELVAEVDEEGGGEPPMSTSNSFDVPDNVQLETRYVYNDTSEMGMMPEIQYTDTDF